MDEKGTMTATFELTPELRGLLGLRDREYVVKDPVEIVVETEDGDRLNPPQDIRERIVRCRDCKHAMEHRSKSILGTELVTLTCSGPIQGAYSEGADVEPEGFCAWGERKSALIKEDA